MAKKQQPTTPHRRSREELVVEAFRSMIQNGEAERKVVTWLTALGGYETKIIYKVEPLPKPTPEIAALIDRVNPKKK